ncbi:N-acetylglutaminylglutamine amidotransferase [Plasticicumulans acidivorans]|uniref:asparagine synthase (glutamine-hydrolyzing) n=1 Tax=Plasticicumulans acidivorans TaxID=886464 RepID=A0A317MU12_9GAMM|nr:N-acetylglutaminylglutamine amidotransferase [Plasticicumulans acidivorans]PWV61134.1 asparagine synthase (glutamine-hydrolysing) [Plasticicumulans acidivorans]
MCGLAGELRFDSRLVDATNLQRMSAVLAPRGPDDAGLWLQGSVGFAHRRLSIMDLAAASAQPMVDAGLGLAIVFNGAIYNYRELREELRALGYTFSSDGDTEVLLKGFHAWGEALLPRLNGMFALALWNRDTRELFLARDRIGIKPLYLTRDAQRLRFASTLPALLAGGDVDSRLDPVALNHYLSFHSVVPAPRTLLRGVSKLAPGHWLRLGADGQTTEHCWWQPQWQPREDERALGVEDWIERLDASLTAAVRRRNVAAVEVGVLLSGGVDSSLLVALLRAAGQASLATFSIGFEDAGDEAGNEFRYSDLIARRFATRHQRIHIDSAELLAALPAAIAAMSEPMVSHDCVAFHLLSREVARHCKVVQSGQGADELFAGYHWYPLVAAAQDPLAAYCQAFLDSDHAGFLATVAPAWAVTDHAGEFVREHFARPGVQDGLARALRLDTQVMLVEDPVKRVDNMTMAWGLEARVPFLDHEVVELAARMPGTCKLPGGGKHVLKELARRYIPAEVIDRPKGYFPVPGLKYLQGETLTWVADALHSTAARERGLFAPAAVAALLADPQRHITPLRGSRLWQLALLELWLQTQNL